MLRIGKELVLKTSGLCPCGFESHALRTKTKDLNANSVEVFCFPEAWDSKGGGGTQDERNEVERGLVAEPGQEPLSIFERAAREKYLVS